MDNITNIIWWQKYNISVIIFVKCCQLYTLKYSLFRRSSISICYFNTVLSWCCCKDHWTEQIKWSTSVVNASCRWADDLYSPDNNEHHHNRPNSGITDLCFLTFRFNPVFFSSRPHSFLIPPDCLSDKCISYRPSPSSCFSFPLLFIALVLSIYFFFLLFQICLLKLSSHLWKNMIFQTSLHTVASKTRKN